MTQKYRFSAIPSLRDKNKTIYAELIQSFIDINISVDRYIQRKDDDDEGESNHNFVSLLLLSTLFFRLDCSPLTTDGSNCSMTIEGNWGAAVATNARSSSGLRKLKLNLRILNENRRTFSSKKNRTLQFDRSPVFDPRTSC